MIHCIISAHYEALKDGSISLLRGAAEAIQNLKAPRCARAELYMDRHGRKLPPKDMFVIHCFYITRSAC